MIDMAPRLRQHLVTMEVPFAPKRHRPTSTASETAEAAHVPGAKLVKAVLVRDGQGLLLAVLASTHHIDFDLLKRALGRQLELVPEPEISDVFFDCAEGAVPAFGAVYGVPVVMDTALLGHDELFVEAGDHRHVVGLKTKDFIRLMRHARRASFAVAGPVHASEPAAEPSAPHTTSEEVGNA